MRWKNRRLKYNMFMTYKDNYDLLSSKFIKFSLRYIRDKEYMNMSIRIEHHDLLASFYRKNGEDYNMTLYHNPHSSIDESWYGVDIKDIKGDMLVIYEQLEQMLGDINNHNNK